jgi:hypothetical protein
MTDPAEHIAAAVLYEGYLLWPYRRSARKNRQRWTFGGVHPRAYSEACQGSDPWLMQTQCLIAGEEPSVAATVRFLHVVERRVARQQAMGALEFVDALQVGEERYLAWEEATERQVSAPGLRLSALQSPQQVAIDVPAGETEEPLTAPDGEVVGALVRRWRELRGTAEIMAAAVQTGLWRLTVRLANATPWDGRDRDSALQQAFVSTHVLLHVEGGGFISLMDPPEALQQTAAACENLHTWPVLVGKAGERHTMLSSPIILYDYPQIAPESPGDLFDGTEIDQLLTLNTWRSPTRRRPRCAPPTRERARSWSAPSRSPRRICCACMGPSGSFSGSVKRRPSLLSGRSWRGRRRRRWWCGAWRSARAARSACGPGPGAISWTWRWRGRSPSSKPSSGTMRAAFRWS